MIRRALLLAVVLLAGAPAAADPAGVRMTSSQGLSVAGTAERFEVFTRAGAEARAYFCAAGEFARRVGARMTDRVVVVSGPARSLTRPNRLSIVYTVSTAPARPDTSVFSVFLRPSVPGSARPVGHAIALCNTRKR